MLSDLRFPVAKRSNTLRIFCLGGSAAMGWPHPPSESYPTFLARKLQLLYPDKTIEVINAAASTYASYRVKIIFDEIIHYDPDLILLYSGNNEFLERILYNPEAALLAPWKHLATARIVHRAWQQFVQPKQVIDIENYRPTFLIDVALGNTSTLKVSQEQYRKVVEHYRYNMTGMVSAAQQRAVPIMLLSVPVNVRDWHPHASVHRNNLDSAAQQQWNAGYARGVDAFQSEQPKEAIRHFSGALAIDDQFAELHYYTGKAYEQLRQFPEARSHLMQSLEADAYPFRALPVFNRHLKAISQEYAVPLVDIERSLSEQAVGNMIGEDLLVDHVHPTVVSNQQIADALLEEMMEAGVLPKQLPEDPDALWLAVPDQSEATLPLMQHLFLIYRVLLQFDKMDTLYQRCLALPAYEKQRVGYQRFISDFDAYLRVMQPYREMLMAHKTGQLHQKYTRSEITEVVEDYVSLSKQNLTDGMPDREFKSFVPTFVN